MVYLRIKNIGPLTDTGVIPITNIMLIIGEQSTGKSTFMKILSFCRWIEKNVMLGKYEMLEKLKKKWKNKERMKDERQTDPLDRDPLL